MAIKESKIWDGKGLPPVGCIVEARFGGEWVEVTVAYTEKPKSEPSGSSWNEALVFDRKTKPFWADEFRPINSESDKKRDAFAMACVNVDRKGEWSNSHAFFLGIYDAIAAGKIPGARIE